MTQQALFQAIDKALEDLGKNPFVPESISSFIQGVIKIQRQNPPQDIEMPVSTTSESDFANGTALYGPKDFRYDPESTARILGQLIAFLSHDATYTDVAKTLKVAIEDGSFRLEQAFKAYTHMEAEFFELWNAKLNIKSSLLLFIIQSSLAPSFELCAQQIQQKHSLELWNEQYCPCCGNEPLIAYWLESVGKQYNICSFCATQYRAQRMQCTYCGERNHESLRYIEAEELPHVHMQTCTSCNNYIKILDRKGQSTPLTPAIDDVSTLIIDVAGKQQGFTRPVLSAFGF